MDGQKCEHGPCSCYVDLGETYCGEHCREAEKEDPDEAPHGRCGCRHQECVNGV